MKYKSFEGAEDDLGVKVGTLGFKVGDLGVEKWLWGSNGEILG